MNPNPLPFMSVAVDKWLLDTAALRASEYQVLHRMLCHEWRSGCPLPSDSTLLSRVIGIPEDDVRQALTVISAFFRDNGLGLVNDELESERARAINLRDSRRRGAQKTNDSRAERSAERNAEHDAKRSLSEAGATRPHTHTHTSPSPSPTPQRSEGEHEREPGVTPSRVTNGSAAIDELSQVELQRKVLTMHRNGSKPGDIVRLFGQYGVTAKQVRQWVAHDQH